MMTANDATHFNYPYYYKLAGDNVYIWDQLDGWRLSHAWSVKSLLSDKNTEKVKPRPTQPPYMEVPKWRYKDD